ncbi:hypothetical protein D779_2176 [Imhoffiella purpurea]|uniref:Uncharacterized protein n=1 Tax=Imhoffiella purpurea TaxID=1249627 RepID=W9VFK8_9GAMM|nr:hypothetical protein D779_2176 [Imhoffiella purpurea]
MEPIGGNFKQALAETARVQEEIGLAAARQLLSRRRIQDARSVDFLPLHRSR